MVAVKSHTAGSIRMKLVSLLSLLTLTLLLFSSTCQSVNGGYEDDETLNTLVTRLWEMKRMEEGVKEVAAPAKRHFRMQSECERDSECGSDHCCVPTVSKIRECRPLRDQYESCHPGSHATPFWGSRGFPLCPCRQEYKCNAHTWKCER